MSKKLKNLSRRDFLRLAATGAGGALLASCSTPLEPEKIIETVIVEKEGETIIETVVVEAEPASMEKPEIQLMRWGGVESEQATIDEFLEGNPEIADKMDVTVLSPGNHDAEVYQYMRLALAAGTRMPDAIVMNYIGVPEFASQDLLTDISAEMASYESDLYEGAIKMSQYNGKYIAVPRQLKTKIWYYRKDMFEEAGIDPKAVKTFDDYMEAGRKIMDTFPGSYIMNVGPQPIHYWYFMILMNWDGDEVRIANEDGSYNLVGNPHYETLMTWLKTWQDEIAFQIDDWAPDWQPAFADGTIAGSLISQWMDGFLPGYAPHQAGLWGKTLWPEFNVRGSEAVGSVTVIPKHAEYPAEAFELLSARYLGTDLAVDAWKKDGSQLPMIKSATEIIEKMIADGYEKPADVSDEDWAVNPLPFFGDDYMDAHFEHLSNHFNTFPYDPAASAELDILRRNTEAYIAEEKTLEEAIADAQSEMETQIGNPYEV